MTNETNNTGVSEEILLLVGKGEEAEGGPLKLIKQFPKDIEALTNRVNHALSIGNKAVSSRSVVLDFFASQPEGEKLLDQRAKLKGKGLSRNEKDRRTVIDARIKKVEGLLIRTVKCANVLTAFLKADFVVTIRLPSKVGKQLVTYIHGPEDEAQDAVMFSVRALLALDGINLANVSKIGDVPTSTGKRKGAVNTDGSSANGEAIAPSKLSDTLNAVDTTLAKYDLSKKDNGLPPNAVQWALRVWAHLSNVLTDVQKKEALKAYADEAAPEADEAAAI